MDKNRVHFELEKQLAKKILSSKRENRFEVVRECYDKLYETITWHSGINLTEEKKKEIAEKKLEYFGAYVKQGDSLVEVGCGDGVLLMALSPKLQNGIGLDPSLKKLSLIKKSENISIMPMNSYEIPVDDNSLDVVISSQVIEHIHPDDLDEHLKNIYIKLKDNGKYIFDTPNGCTGPHDISKYFTPEPEGFHLKEYTFAELKQRLTRSGFRIIKGIPLSFGLLKKLRLKPHNFVTDISILVLTENLLKMIPVKAFRTFLFRIFNLNNIFIIAEK